MRIRHFISDRFGGVSTAPYDSLNIAFHVGDDPENVERNRQILYQKAGIHKAQFADQIHSDKILTLDRFIDPPACDGFITTVPNLPLAVMGADCFGVLLYDPEHFVIAALHAGRAGAMQGIVTKAINKMRSLGARNIDAIIGPGIHSCCYEVGPQILKITPARFIKNGTHIDIKGIIYEQLHEEGVRYI